MLLQVLLALLARWINRAQQYAITDLERRRNTPLFFNRMSCDEQHPPPWNCNEKGGTLRRVT